MSFMTDMYNVLTAYFSCLLFQVYHSSLLQQLWELINLIIIVHQRICKYSDISEIYVLYTVCNKLFVCCYNENHTTKHKMVRDLHFKPFSSLNLDMKCWIVPGNCIWCIGFFAVNLVRNWQTLKTSFYGYICVRSSVNWSNLTGTPYRFFKFLLLFYSQLYM